MCIIITETARYRIKIMKNMPQTDQTETRPAVPPAPNSSKIKLVVQNCLSRINIRGRSRNELIGIAAIIVAVLGVIVYLSSGGESREDKQAKRTMSHRSTARNTGSSNQVVKQFKDAMYSLYGHGRPMRSEYRSSSAYDKMEKAAAAGYSPAQYVHGWLLLHGWHASQVEGIKWLKKAAESNHVYAQEVLGMAYLKGIGTSVDKAKAVMWLKKAAAQNNVNASLELLDLYHRKEAVGMSEKEAIDIVVNLYNYGSLTDDENNLELLVKGTELPEGLKGPLRWIDHGDEAYIKRDERYKKEWATAVAYAKKGNVWGEYIYGEGMLVSSLKSEDSEERDEGLKYLEKAAAKGHVLALESLAHYYNNKGKISQASAMYHKLLDRLPVGAEVQADAWECWRGVAESEDD